MAIHTEAEIKLMAPFMKGSMRKGNAKAMETLQARLENGGA